jgi:xylan 1,4-beta-xylosidase
MLTWAFEFEDQPYFDGFRTLATNGIDKPVLNLFRMAGKMQGDRVRVESSNGMSVQTMIAEGVRGKPDVDALAVRGDRGISMLVWNYHDDDDAAAGGTNVRIEVSGMNFKKTGVLLSHYRIDETHSNAWTAWKKMGSPQQPSAEQYRALEAAGKLQEMEPPRWTSKGGNTSIEITLPRQAVSLVRLWW